jgi:DNA-binding protein H-NS
MAKVDLSSLTLKDLIALRNRVEKAIARHEKKAKSEALAALKAKAREMGFSLDELTDGAPKTKAPTKSKTTPRKPAKIRYRDPSNPKNTWGGRGPKPQWIKDAVAAGKSQDDFKV